MTTQKSRGGRRPGAGRPPINGVATVCGSVSLTPDVREYLATLGSVSGQIERLVRHSRGFREWASNRSSRVPQAPDTTGTG
jgi:hypothetical protein